MQFSLLSPGEDRFNISVKDASEIDSLMGSAPHILILDGTWICAGKILKRSKNLHKLRKVSFDNKIKSKNSIKQQPDSLCRSKIESFYTVLNLLNEVDLERCDTKHFLFLSKE